MFYNAKNKSIAVGSNNMSYCVFGKGEVPLVLIPGLGFTSVEGQAVQLAFKFKDLAKKFKVYIFSRIDNLPEGYTTRDMAENQNYVMEKLNIKNVIIYGISMGGMVAQQLAINHPDKVKKLIISVTISKPNDTLLSSITRWVKMARLNQYKELIIDLNENVYSEKALRKKRRMYPILTRMGKPTSMDFFIKQASACLSQNIYEQLDSIKCDTLVIGADNDKIVGKNSSEEIAERIERSKLIIYEGGHSIVEEVKEYNETLMGFLLRD
ncbi:alpha/beta hydrolase [Vallitalea sediminicola]